MVRARSAVARASIGCGFVHKDSEALLADAISGAAAFWQLEELYHGELQRRKELAMSIALNDMLAALGLKTSGELHDRNLVELPVEGRMRMMGEEWDARLDPSTVPCVS